MLHIQKEKIFFLSKSELIDYIKNNFHSKIIKLFNQIEKLDKKIENNSSSNNDSLLKELLKQFKFELNEHVKREHKKYFEFLLKVKKDGIYDIDLFETIISVENAEHIELKTYIKGIIKILEKFDNDKYKLLINKMNELYDLIVKTIMYEDYLIEKVRTEILK